MNEAVFEKKLEELVKELSSMPGLQREKLTILVAQANDRHKQLREKTQILNESLDYLKVGIKYLVFDLEATRRENSYLRQLLENSDR